ncbi:MAG TPA: hypothetical protein VFC38_04730 [Stellaceae bacterium]|nr:hypothetical protein [Stellaceae bacterium]
MDQAALAIMRQRNMQAAGVGHERLPESLASLIRAPQLNQDFGVLADELAPFVLATFDELSRRLDAQPKCTLRAEEERSIDCLALGDKPVQRCTDGLGRYDRGAAASQQFIGPLLGFRDRIRRDRLRATFFEAKDFRRDRDAASLKLCEALVENGEDVDAGVGRSGVFHNNDKTTADFGIMTLFPDFYSQATAHTVGPLAGAREALNRTRQRGRARRAGGDHRGYHCDGGGVIDHGAPTEAPRYIFADLPKSRIVALGGSDVDCALDQLGLTGAGRAKRREDVSEQAAWISRGHFGRRGTSRQSSRNARARSCADFGNSGNSLK